MGYNTNYSGQLRFYDELLGTQLAHLNKILGADTRDLPELEKHGNFYFVDLMLTDDNMGLVWDGSEKTYDMVGQIRTILNYMRKVMPRFTLHGTLEYASEEYDDSGHIVVEGTSVVNLPRESK
jgi:hypothetical protein